MSLNSSLCVYCIKTKHRFGEQLHNPIEQCGCVREIQSRLFFNMCHQSTRPVAVTAAAATRAAIALLPASLWFSFEMDFCPVRSDRNGLANMSSAISIRNGEGVRCVTSLMPFRRSANSSATSFPCLNSLSLFTKPPGEKLSML